MMIIWLLVLSLGLLLGVQSEKCAVEPGSYLNVSDQNDLNYLSSSCTAIHGNLMIARNFTGPFYLSNITNITGELVLDTSAYAPPLNVTSIELPDLQHLNSGIYIEKLAGSLKRLACPKLEYLHSMALIQYIDHAEVDLGGLKKSQGLLIRGNYSNLGSLQNVTEGLSICNTNRCGVGYREGPGPRRAMEVSLPNLEVAGRVTVAGDLSSLRMPKFSYGNLRVISQNTSVRFDFPQLTRTGYSLDLQGNISSLSLPGLEEVRGSMSIGSSHPLNVSVPLLKADGISLSGQIEDVSFPNLNNASTISIDSDLPIDCGKLTNAINSTYEGPKETLLLSCRSTREEPSSGLSTKAKVAIGVVVGVVGLSLIIGWIFWKSRGSRRKGVGESGSAIELTTFGTGLRREDPRQRQGQEQGQSHGEAEGQDNPPPPYTARE